MADKSGLDAVRDALHHPVDATPPAFDDGNMPAYDDGYYDTAPDGPDYDGPDGPDDAGGGGRSHGWDDLFSLPPKCPVVPVGTESGTFFFLTSLGELRALTADKVANKHVLGMFAPRSDYLREFWPRRTLVAVVDENGKTVNYADDDGKLKPLKEWVTKGWRSDDVIETLMNVAAKRGVWNAHDKVRGRGSWLGDDGGLIVHAGNRVLFQGKWMKPGMHEDMVYPTAPICPLPADAPRAAVEIAPSLVAQLRQHGIKVPRDATAGWLLFQLFRLWNWQRPDIDPFLLLGWQVTGFMGSANRFRPLAWVTGDKATGKSTLQEIIGWIHGDGLLQTSDASEAAVRQLLGQQSLPVAVDEAESEGDNRKIMALVKLARLAASSQGSIVRGGSDHVAHEFRATSCFLFSSILIPPLEPQDRSRFAILELNKLPPNQREPILDKREIAALARQMRLEVVMRWPRWPALLAEYRNAMIDHGGHAGRGADQFGTLLAAAHMVLTDQMPGEAELAEWGVKLAAQSLAETAQNGDSSTDCITHMLTSPVQLTPHSNNKPLAKWLAEATEPMGEVDTARDALANIGIAVVKGKGGGALIPGQTYIAVASRHQALNRVFQDSKWSGGVWSQSLGRVDGAVKNHAVRINKAATKCTAVPLSAFLSHEDAAEEAKAEALADVLAAADDGFDDGTRF